MPLPLSDITLDDMIIATGPEGAKSWLAREIDEENIRDIADHVKRGYKLYRMPAPEPDPVLAPMPMWIEPRRDEALRFGVGGMAYVAYPTRPNQHRDAMAMLRRIILTVVPMINLMEIDRHKLDADDLPPDPFPIELDIEGDR